LPTLLLSDLWPEKQEKARLDIHQRGAINGIVIDGKINFL
jgi:hypothetical protein